MADGASITRIARNGNSFYFALPTDLMRDLGWSRYDRLAIRRHANTLVVERIPLEQLALIRKPEDTNHAE